MEEPCECAGGRGHVRSTVSNSGAGPLSGGWTGREPDSGTGGLRGRCWERPCRSRVQLRLPGVGGSSPASTSGQLLGPVVQDRLRVRTGSPKARATQCLLLEVVAVPGLGGSAVALEMRREAAGLTAARQRLTFPLSGMDKCEPGDFCRCVGKGEAPL